MEITKDSIIGDILDADVSTAEYFFAIGMHCLGCPASRGESIADACAAHGTNADELVEKLQAHFAGK
jgi:hybrid cluster-associated redox disulfide protein